MLFLLFLAGCQDVERTFMGARAQADRIAATGKLLARQYTGGSFDLLGYERFGRSRDFDRLS